MRWLDDVLADLKTVKIRQWAKKKKVGEQWRLVVEEAKAHPGLQHPEDGRMDLTCFSLMTSPCSVRHSNLLRM